MRSLTEVSLRSQTQFTVARLARHTQGQSEQSDTTHNGTETTSRKSTVHHSGSHTTYYRLTPVQSINTLACPNLSAVHLLLSTRAFSPFSLSLKNSLPLSDAHLVVADLHLNRRLRLILQVTREPGQQLQHLAWRAQPVGRRRLLPCNHPLRHEDAQTAALA